MRLEVVDGRHSLEEKFAYQYRALIESPLVYPYPKNTRNSDYGLSFPSPETQTMV